MLKFHLLLFLFSTTRSKNLLVELADDNTTKSFYDKLGKIIQEMTEEDKALFSLIKGPGVFTNGGGDSDYMSVAESKRRGCRGIRNIRPCLNARDGTQCNAGGNPKWSNSECCNGCCRHTRNVYKKVPGAANSCGIYESFKRAMKNGCSGITNIAQCMNKPDGTSCSRGDKWPDSECCNGCCKHTYHVYKHVPDARNSCGLMASVKRAIADGCQGIPNFSQCLDKPDSTECERYGASSCCKGCCRQNKGRKNTCGIGPAFYQVKLQGHCAGRANIEGCLGKPDGTSCLRSGWKENSSCCKQCCMANGSQKRTEHCG